MSRKEAGRRRACNHSFYTIWFLMWVNHLWWELGFIFYISVHLCHQWVFFMQISISVTHVCCHWRISDGHLPEKSALLGLVRDKQLRWMCILNFRCKLLSWNKFHPLLVLSWLLDSTVYRDIDGYAWLWWIDIAGVVDLFFNYVNTCLYSCMKRS